MWQAFKDDIEMTAYEFKNREEFDNWVRGWVEDSISEIGRVERYYLGVDDPTDGLDIKIGEDTSEEEAYEQDREWDKLRHGRE